MNMLKHRKQINTYLGNVSNFKQYHYHAFASWHDQDEKSPHISLGNPNQIRGQTTKQHIWKTWKQYTTTLQMKFNEQVEKWRFRIYKLSEFNLFIGISPHNKNIKH